MTTEWYGRLPSFCSGARARRAESAALRGWAFVLPLTAGGGPEMNAVHTVVGVDVAKNVFQAHWVAPETGEIYNIKIKRARFLEHFAGRSRCLIGMEACGGAQHWARELSKLGHTVKLMAAQFVNPYRKSGKNDANDAEAICEAVGRPNMRFVSVPPCQCEQRHLPGAI